MDKKILMLTAVLAAASMAFAACGADSGNGNTAPAETSAAASTESSADSAADTAETSETEDILPDESESLEPLPADNDEGSSNPLMPAIDRITSESEWPFLSEITDTVMLKEYFLLDPENSNYKNLIVMQCPMSAVMSEIIIIEAEDVSAAEADLDARKKKAVEQDAWYPNDQELAASSIVGTSGSYAYYIIGENAEAAAKSLSAYLSE